MIYSMNINDQSFSRFLYKSNIDNIIIMFPLSFQAELAEKLKVPPMKTLGCVGQQKTKWQHLE